MESKRNYCEFKPGEQNDSSKAFSTFKKQAWSAQRGKKKWNKKPEPSTGKSEIQCFTCKQYGHKSFECPRKKKNPSEMSLFNINTEKKGAFVVYPPGVSSDDDWFIDSGSSFHMTPRDDWLLHSKIKPIDYIVAANNSTMNVQSSGKVVVDVDRHGSDAEVPSVMYCT